MISGGDLMNPNERVKELRKALGLTQGNFGEKIGLKQAVIGQMEKGSRNLTDRTVLLICEKYSVNEEWLRYGTGPMFIESDSTIVSQLSSVYGLDAFEKVLIEGFLKNETGRTGGNKNLRPQPDRHANHR